MKKTHYTVQTSTSISEIKNYSATWKEFLQTEVGACSLRNDPEHLLLNIKAGVSPFIVIVKCNGKIVCIAPSIINSSRFNFKFSVLRSPGIKARTMKLITSELLFASQVDKEECIELVLKEWEKSSNQFDFIYLEMLERKSPLGRYLEKSNYSFGTLKLKNTSPKTEYVWRHYLLSTYADWTSTLGKSTRRLIKRRVKKLHTDFPNKVELKIVSDIQNISTYLKNLNYLYPKTWQGKTFGIKKRDTQKDIELLECIAERGWLRSYMLFLEGQPVAFFTGTQYEGTYQAGEIGYDSSYASLGVGSALNYMVIEDLYNNNKPQSLSFGFGENIYKSMICNDKSEAYEAYITQPGLFRFLISLQVLISATEESVRSVLVKFKIDDTIRKLLKRK